MRRSDTSLAFVRVGGLHLTFSGADTCSNELADDGRTVYAAARSTGRIEKGPVGHALAAIDEDVVGRRFRPLEDPWPFVPIAAPPDRRHGVGEAVELRTLVLAPENITGCHGYAADVSRPAGARELAVRAVDTSGRKSFDVIEPLDAVGDLRLTKAAGSDADVVDAWPERGLLGTRLGPNRNGRPR